MPGTLLEVRFCVQCVLICVCVNMVKSPPKPFFFFFFRARKRVVNKQFGTLERQRSTKSCKLQGHTKDTQHCQPPSSQKMNIYPREGCWRDDVASEHCKSRTSLTCSQGPRTHLHTVFVNADADVNEPCAVKFVVQRSNQCIAVSFITHR